MWSIGIWKPIDRKIWGLGHSWMRASPLGGLMLSLGMRLPRKSRGKTRTLLACVLKCFV